MLNQMGCGKGKHKQGIPSLSQDIFSPKPRYRMEAGVVGRVAKILGVFVLEERS